MTNGSNFCLLGLPYDGNSSYLRGPSKGPDLIREAIISDHWNSFAENGIDTSQLGWSDCGNLTLTEKEGQDIFDEIYSNVKKLLEKSDGIVSLGGDHSITYPVIKAHAEKFPGLNILHIDAHPDLYETFENNRFSHASPFARLLEDGACKRLVQIGIRTLNTHQRQQAKRYGVEIIDMQSWVDTIVLDFHGPVYLSVDLDCLDPAFAPGVSHLEPGGFSTRQVLNIISQFKGVLVGADVVEYNPLRDIGTITATVAAKFVKEIFGRLSTDHNKQM